MNAPTELIDDLRLLEPAGPWWTQWWGIALVALAVAISGFLLWRRYAAEASPEAEPVTPEVAQEDALAELQRLFALVEKEQSRPFAIESSAIVRRYIERRFELRAPRRSTEEFLAEARQSPKLAAPHQELLGRFLGCCDFIKFARGVAIRSELEELHRSAVNFVTETRADAAPKP